MAETKKTAAKKTAAKKTAAKAAPKKTAAKKATGAKKTPAAKAAPRKTAASRKAASASKPKPEKTVRITLVKSVIGTRESHRATVRGLGLRRIRHEVERPDTPAIRGMVDKIPHLVELVEEG